MITIQQALTQATTLLTQYSSSASLDSQVLLAHVLAKPRSYLLTWPERALTSVQQQTFAALVAERAQGMPVAYLVAEQEFWSLALEVSPSTLIPRADTETLVEHVLTMFDQTPIACLDLGTGTGAIALALASERPQWQIDALDVQIDAVELAKRNRQRHGFTQVNIFQSDWFSAIAVAKRYQLIVSNPPYIDERDAHLAQGDVRFEPKSALVAQQQGLADILLIAEQARHYLSEQGLLVLEHGYQQKAEVQAILATCGYQNIHTVADLAGNDRISCATFSQLIELKDSTIE
jgi:release factor glutamine methyltransferase